MTTLSIVEWMEDFDNLDLSEDERDEQLMEAVQDYNFETEMNLDPKREVKNYKAMLKRRNLEEPTE